MKKDLFCGLVFSAVIFVFQGNAFSLEANVGTYDFKQVKISISACMDKADSIKIEDGELMWVTTPKRLGSTSYIPGTHKNCGEKNNVVTPIVKVGQGKAMTLPVDERYWTMLKKERNLTEPYEEFFVGTFDLKDLGFKEASSDFGSEILFISEDDLEENQKICSNARVCVTGQNVITIRQRSFDYCQFQFTYMYIPRDN